MTQVGGGSVINPDSDGDDNQDPNQVSNQVPNQNPLPLNPFLPNAPIAPGPPPSPQLKLVPFQGGICR